MRTRTLAGLVGAAALTLLVPAGAFAQTDTLLADNPVIDCDAPLPASMVSGDLGSTVVVVEDAQIDKVTLAAGEGGAVLDASFSDGSTEATIETSTETSAYIAWSCAPVNGEPVQQNADDEV